MIQQLLFYKESNSDKKTTLVSDLWDVLFFFTDTVFFHLPPRCGDRTTVYGVSCYRQIEAKVTFQAMNNITEVIGLMH